MDVNGIDMHAGHAFNCRLDTFLDPPGHIWDSGSIIHHDIEIDDNSLSVISTFTPLDDVLRPNNEKKYYQQYRTHT